jgi:hypothetical protein
VINSALCSPATSSRYMLKETSCKIPGRTDLPLPLRETGSYFIKDTVSSSSAIKKKRAPVTAETRKENRE